MKLIRKALVFTVACSAAASACAQNRKQDFEEYRKELLGGYNEFRTTILDHYADFLNGEWHEYESLNGEKRYKTPKPKTAPAVETPVPERPALPEPAAPPVVEKPVTTPSVPVEDTPGFTEISFFEIPVQVPRVDFNIHQQLSSTSDYGRQWKLLADNKVAQKVVPILKDKASEMGLNDYLTYELVKAYVDALFPDKDVSSRFSAIHYLLANLGYDVRIAATTDGAPLLLVPFDRMVYARPYMMVGGKKYYVFAPDSFDIEALGQRRIMTCELPADIDHGKVFGLVVGELNLPYEPHEFSISDGPVTLKGEVNKNLMPVLYRYPQMGVEGFALSNIQPGLRHSLTDQVKSQLAGMEDEEAVNTLLRFTQNAFDYATDEDYHGFEKPYFLEETLFYPKNDCEDRAIFYTYFLWNALGREAQLISFPGHEAAAVSLETPVKGTSYNYEGTRFYISDPTYIGATTGMVMPVYRNENPTVDYTYKNN